MKSLMKYYLFAGIMALLGCTDEKTEELIIEQPNSFQVEVEGDDTFSLSIPNGEKIGINGQEVQVLSNGQVSLYEIPAGESYTVYYPSNLQPEGNRLKFDIPQQQTYRAGKVDVAACPYYSVVDNAGLATVKLKPAFGALKLLVPSNQEFATVSSVVLTSVSDDITADRIELDLENGTVQVAGKAARRVVLQGDIDMTEDREIFIALPPQTFTGKLDVSLVGQDGGGTYSLDLSGQSIKAGQVLSATLDAIAWEKRIYYYGTANSVQVQPGQQSVTVNCAAYYTTSSVYAYENHPAEEDLLPLSAAQLWNDVAVDYVKGVSLSSDRKSFTVTFDGRPGNAVIAIYDNPDPKAKGANILWSFHIWVTELNEISLETNVIGNKYTVLDRNLGATSVEPGNTSSIGLLYQWGRKDPFVGAGEYGKNTNAKMYNELGEVSFATVKGGASTGTVKYAIMNPTKFIMYSRSKSNVSTLPYYCAYDWLYHADWSLWGNPQGYTFPHSSDLVKSIYDPSPEGYMVSPNDTWMGTVEGYDKSSSVFADATWQNGYVFAETENMVDWYPIGGWRSRKTGKLADANAKGYYWCSSADKEKSPNSVLLTIMKDGVNLKSTNCRANSSSIRCVKITK